ncbi:hypothetical protein ACFL27_27210 [candidate division CSSED10-310 bacterium]|uniref:NarG-like domain-containing protein n=1 Tax=candidate division CSSED10-310 bacterium TaxID=2855610 RepID=A0ABV6Z641_UNCC1
MYDFLTGPFVWVTFFLFFGGSIYKIVTMLQLAKREKVIYPFMEFKYSFRSIIHWIVPFASRNMRLRPVMTVVTFAFHLSLLIAPLFLIAHNVLWQKAWGFSLWTISELTADIMTIIVICGCLFFLLRRILAVTTLKPASSRAA